MKIRPGVLAVAVPLMFTTLTGCDMTADGSGTHLGPGRRPAYASAG
ncbi:hypothetical protein ACIGXF_08175 [Streptomyces sp. NPDC053086]